MTGRQTRNDLNWDLQEPLGVRWEGELLFLDIPDGRATLARSIRAVTDGAKSYAAQYDEQAGTLVVCMDAIEADARVTLRPAKAADAATPLSVTRKAGGLAIRNAAVEFLVPDRPSVRDLGTRWEIEGPILAVTGKDRIAGCRSRLLVDKTPFFAHDRESIRRAHPERIEEEEAVPTVTARVVEKGPVFVRYSYEVSFPGQRRYDFCATVYANLPYALIRETLDTARGGQLELKVTEGYGFDTYFFGGAGRSSEPRSVPIPQSPFRIGSLTPHHTQTHTAYPWLGFAASDRPQGVARGIVDADVRPHADTIVVMGYKPWEWEYPAESTLEFQAESGHVTASGPLRRGRRAWCLFLLPRAEALQTGAGGPGYGAYLRLSPLALWHRKINDLPFDWVRRMDLASGALTPQGYQSSMLTREEWAERKKGIWRELTASPGYLLAHDSMSSRHVRWLLHEDREALAKLAQGLQVHLEGKLKIMLATGFLSDDLSAVANRDLGPMAVWFEACVEGGVLDESTRARLHKLLLFMAYCTASDALFPSHHNYQHPSDPHSIRNWSVREFYSTLFGTPNFQTDVYLSLGLFGAVFTAHPLSRVWMEESARQMEAQLGAHFQADGTYAESIGYFVHMFHKMLILASVLRRKGVRDFYADAKFQAAIRCCADYLGAPRRPTLEMGGDAAGAAWQRFYPAIGDTGGAGREAMLQNITPFAAWEVRGNNRELSDYLLASWVENGSPVWGSYPPFFEVFYLRQLRPKVGAFRPLPRRFQTVGVLLRAEVGTPAETSLFFRSGRATHHWGLDHGHFTLIARGSLLIPDFGYYGAPGPREPNVHGYHSWVHNMVTFGPYDNGGTGVERRNSEPVVKLGGEFDYVVADLATNRFLEKTWRNSFPCEGIAYHRHLLFAANRYVFVWDRIDWSLYPSQLRIGCLARSLKQRGGQLRFEGLDGVDLLVQVVQPAALKIQEGLLAAQRYALLEQDCQRDYVWVCQPLGAGEEPFEIEGGEGWVTVRGKDLHGSAFEDRIVFTKEEPGACIAAGNQKIRLSGRLAVLRSENGRQSTHLLDAQDVQVLPS